MAVSIERGRMLLTGFGLSGPPLELGLGVIPQTHGFAPRKMVFPTGKIWVLLEKGRCGRGMGASEAVTMCLFTS